MREIKFRAWRPSEKEWVPDVYLENEGWHYTESIDDHEPEILLQMYTGLRDRNDAEIYEGDIIKFNRDVLVVEYQPPRYTSVRFHNKSEVIGNIYENPELLN